MKKFFFLLLALLPVGVWSAAPLMLVNPGRETFLNFPSAILPDKTVTVFLPEAAVPLKQKYPVVYMLGVWPKDAPVVQEVLDKSTQKAILVGLNVDEADLADSSKLVNFFSQELIPYIDTNYPTITEPSARAIAARGVAGTKVLAALLARKNLFGRAFVADSGLQPISFAGADKNLRVLASGPRAEVAVLWQTLSELGFSYGTRAAVLVRENANFLKELNLDYLFASAQDVEIDKIEGGVSPRMLFISPDQTAQLDVRVILNNGMSFDYIPLDLRLAPPYLSWDGVSGQLRPLPGATAGKVKITVFVDNLKFNTKIKLKK